MSRTRNIAEARRRVDPFELRTRRGVVVDVLVDALWDLLRSGRTDESQAVLSDVEASETVRDLELPSPTENASMALRPGARTRPQNQGGDR